MAFSKKEISFLLKAITKESITSKELSDELKLFYPDTDLHSEIQKIWEKVHGLGISEEHKENNVLLIENIEKLEETFVTADIIIDSDTILADIMNDNYESLCTSGIAQEIFDLYIHTYDKASFESLFETLTGYDFYEYLTLCYNDIIKGIILKKTIAEKTKRSVNEEANDVCIWSHLTDEFIEPKKHSSKPWRLSDKIEYCPYCGKTIKFDN